MQVLTLSTNIQPQDNNAKKRRTVWILNRASLKSGVCDVNNSKMVHYDSMITFVVSATHFPVSLHIRFKELFIRRSPSHVVRGCNSHMLLNLSHARGSYGGCTGYRLIEYTLGNRVIELGTK
jgi:hypothetical protein